jgi:predicted phosphoribosyltransferase
MEQAPFRDRREAGRRLAQALAAYRHRDPLVLGLPRGGVPVAYEVARALRAPLDVVVARKLGAPSQPELAIGAIGPGGVIVLDERYGLAESDLEAIIARETAEMERRIRRFRGHDGVPNVEGRTVIVVDDGLATGLTVRAALKALRRGRPAWIVLAVPVAAPDTAARIAQGVDDFVCLETPDAFYAIGQWYLDFEPVSNETVVDVLERARRAHRGVGGDE